jgi:hypothetical protein
MADVTVFADESGDMVFTPQSSAYFILGTLTMADCAVGTALLDLRRQLAREGHDLLHEFHATNDHPKTRERVFKILADYDVRFDVTLIDKRKVHPALQGDANRFYKTAWRLHMRYVAPRIATPDDDLLVVAASIKTNVKRQMVVRAIHDVLSEVAPGPHVRMAFWPAAIEPCLQVVDYYCWAVHRKYERRDEHYYTMLYHAIHSEIVMFERNVKTYY